MKVLRIIGIVAAVHAFAFLLIMANPGCSTKPKSPPSTANAGPDASSYSPSITAPGSGSAENSPITSAPMNPSEAAAPASFNPDAIAVSVPRYSPTRPGTPAYAALQAEPVSDVTPTTTVVVGKGDSLWSIAKKHGIPYADLAAANNLNIGATLPVGKKLVVPSRPLGASAAVASEPRRSESKSAEMPVAKPTPNGAVKHVVKAGESLALIAKKYGVRLGDIAEANNISNPAMVMAGRELVIPGWLPPKSSKSAAAGAQKPAAESETPAASKAPVMPTIGVPSSDQDLDAGLKPSGGTQVPVIKLEDNPAPAPAPKE